MAVVEAIDAYFAVKFENRGKYNEKYLSFSFYGGKDGIQVRVHQKAREKLKKDIKEITSRSNGKSIK
ncbi:hypothetical protein [Clostridium sp.]